MRRPRFDLRGRLSLSVVGGVALVLVALIGGFNLVLRQRLTQDANNELFTRASAELASLEVIRGRLSARELPDAAALDARTWVFTGSRAIEHPRTDAVIQRAATELSRGRRHALDVPGAHTRLYAVPVVVARRRLGTVVAEVSLRPYEKTAATALTASVVLGLVVLLVVAIAARLVISAALRPVADMTRQASEWSEADTGLRFGTGPPRDELTHLAATLDGLLDRLATSLRHEQRFSAELSHELRTPLASLIAESQFALRHARTDDQYRAGYERVLSSAQQMSRTLDTLVAAARAEAQHTRGTGDASAAAHAAAEGCSTLAAEQHVLVTVVDPPRPVRLGVDADVAERVLAPLIENGCRYGDTSVTIDIEQLERSVRFVIEDDGQGVPADERERIFEPGWRGGGGNGSGDGAGLGLPLARRLARAVGGEVIVRDSQAGGRFAVELPAG